MEAEGFEGDVKARILNKAKRLIINGSPCHEAASRGSKTGTQGLKGAYERSIIPAQLCNDIIDSLFITKDNPTT